jgi:hypothetical protein
MTLGGGKYCGINAGMNKGTIWGGVLGDNVPPGNGAIFGAKTGTKCGGVLGLNVPPGNGAIAGA